MAEWFSLSMLHSRANPMYCTLYIPHLIAATAHGQPPWRAPQCIQLRSLLARATLSVDKASDAEAWLCRSFGVAQQNDWPLAPIMATADDLPAQHGYWLRALPVHLEPRRDALVMMDFNALDIDTQESKALAQMLSDHLAGENITLHAPQSGRWYLHTASTPALQTSTAEVALGEDVHRYLPQGADALGWHRILTEMQMLLHAHPVNEAREARGLPVINSVWLSSGGTLPAPAPAQFNSVWSNDSAVRALAAHNGARICVPVAAEIEQIADNGNLLITLETLMSPVLGGAEQVWRDAVQVIEQEWIVPLMRALRARRIHALTLVSSNREGIHQFTVRPADALKFWRKKNYL